MRALVFVLGMQLAAGLPAAATSLKEMYDLAGPGAGYDRYVVLETGVTYTGGLWIGATFNPVTRRFEGQGEDVRIVGNGAILDLQGAEITLSYANNRLDIDDCVVVNGNLRYRGYDDDTTVLVPEGSVRYVTFYSSDDYGVRLHGCGQNILVERNLVVDAVDTGPEPIPLNGESNDWLATGISFGLSVEAGGLELFDNWSYHADPIANAELVRHFGFLCDYG